MTTLVYCHHDQPFMIYVSACALSLTLSLLTIWDNGAKGHYTEDRQHVVVEVKGSAILNEGESEARDGTGIPSPGRI